MSSVVKFVILFVAIQALVVSSGLQAQAQAQEAASPAQGAASNEVGAGAVGGLASGQDDAVVNSVTDLVQNLRDATNRLVSSANGGNVGSVVANTLGALNNLLANGQANQASAQSTPNRLQAFSLGRAAT